MNHSILVDSVIHGFTSLSNSSKITIDFTITLYGKTTLHCVFFSLLDTSVNYRDSTYSLNMFLKPMGERLID